MSKNIDFKELDLLLSIKWTQKACALKFGCDPRTIATAIKKKSGLSFDDYAELQLSGTKVKLVQKALALAYEGNVTMLIFCLKNICHWCDSPEVITRDSKLEGTLLIKARKEKEIIKDKELGKEKEN